MTSERVRSAKAGSDAKRSFEDIGITKPELGNGGRGRFGKRRSLWKQAAGSAFAKPTARLVRPNGQAGTIHKRQTISALCGTCLHRDAKHCGQGKTPRVE